MTPVAAARARRAPRAAKPGRRLEGLGPRLEVASRPRSRPAGLVSRPRLVNRLAEGSAAVALLAAPAGYGKTTLLADWRRSDRRPFACVTLDAGHDGMRVLVAAVEEALDEAAPIPAGRLHRGSPAGMPRLVRSLAARPPFVLVLDDVHALRTGAAREAVRTLARNIPPGSRLALSSRTEPELPTARLRANRALTEVRAADLMMTTGEASALLSRSGLEVSAADAEMLARKAEGWPAGLYLASVALRGRPDRPAGVRDFGGDDAIVAEYLRDEVLSHLAPEVASFLLRASVLERLTGPLCDAVLDRRGSAQVLSSLGRQSLLLVPLDSKDDSYRCHGLLAQMLRAELRRSDPEEAARLHGRAGDWYAAAGDPDMALHHAVAAGDSRRAAQVARASAPEFVTQARNAAMRGWLASFSSDQIAAEPGLTLAYANSDLLEGRLDAVFRWESTARRALHERPPRDRTPALESSVALLHAAVARDGIARMGTDAARAYEFEPEDSPWRALCCLLEGVSRQLTGDHDAAELRLEEGVRRGAVAAPNVQTLCLAQLGLGAAERGDWTGADGLAARATAQVDHYALGRYPTSALVFAVSAAVRAHAGRVEEAQADARDAARLLGGLTDFMPWYEAEARLALAHAAQRLSDTAAARDLLADATRIARRMPEAAVLHEWLQQAEDRLEAAPDGQALLTTAELRILGYLPTHLSFREIAARLYVSANTVKTQAHAVYRKLDAASRSEAVTRAAQLGLLDV